MVTSFNKTLASNRCLLLRSPGWSGWKLTATSPRPVSSGAWGFMCIQLFSSIHIHFTSISYPVDIHFISSLYQFHIIHILSFYLNFISISFWFDPLESHQKKSPALHATNIWLLDLWLSMTSVSQAVAHRSWGPSNSELEAMAHSGRRFTY